jgi:hypothetical protein
VVFDVDWLIDPFAQGGSFASLNWPAFRDAWLSVAHGVAQGNFARHLRTTIPTVIQTADRPTDAAQRLADWVRGHLDRH